MTDRISLPVTQVCVDAPSLYSSGFCISLFTSRDSLAAAFPDYSSVPRANNRLDYSIFKLFVNGGNVISGLNERVLHIFPDGKPKWIESGFKLFLSIIQRIIQNCIIAIKEIFHGLLNKIIRLDSMIKKFFS